MSSRAFLRFALLLFICLAGAPVMRAQGIAPSEKAKIESLISHIEGLTDATFIRNGSSYSSKNAAKFLRGKWQANDKEIKSARDFIATAATKSSTSGKPYIIRLKGGTETPCEDYLTARLK